MLEIIVPELAESISEGTIAEWLKKVGEPVNPGEPVIELETDKVNLEVTSDHQGVLKQILKREGEVVQVGEVIGLLEEVEGQDASSAPEAAESGETLERAAEPTRRQEQEVPDLGKTVAEGSRTLPSASPAVRKLARERGIDLQSLQLPGEGAVGRLSAADVERLGQTVASAGVPRPSPAPSPDAGATPPPFLEDAKPVERIRMSRRRQTIAHRLVEAQQTAAMLTTFNEVDMTAILDVRRRRKESFYADNGVRLGFMSFFTKAVIGALKKYPHLNAEIQGEEMLLKKYYDIGIAVAAEEGLVVPVVRNADKLSFADIERQIAELAEKARGNALKLDDLTGGTFTITNGGVFGSLLSTPILNTPQVGILGMHTIQQRPVAVADDRMENRPMMYLALSYDHRIVDGHVAVRFLVKVKQLLEDPESLLLEG